ncbi:polysaccharide lyase [Kitasatospora sp. NPDC002227]|uniref:polysaccharide lyase n=1 Tax=Kitasatospora sp. NPDC002227 TaxID=3154773 RepID=UPI00332BDA3E
MHRTALTAVTALALLSTAGCAATPATAHPAPPAPPATLALSATSAPSAAKTVWTGQFTGYGTAQWRQKWGVATQGSWGEPDLSLVNDPGAPGGGAALQVTYGTGSSSNQCTDCPHPGGGQFYTDLASLGLGPVAKSTTLDLKYHLKFPAGRDWGKAGKLPGLYGGRIGEESGGNHGQGWSTRYMWRGANGSPDNGEVYLYTPTDSGPTGYGVDEGLGTWHFQGDGRWHSIEQLVDRAKGSVTVWYDGRQVYSAPAVASGIADIPFSGLLFSTFYGGHDTSWGPRTTQHAWFADFSLATGPQH